MTDEQRAHLERLRKRGITNTLFPPREPEIADPVEARAEVDAVALRAQVTGLDAFNARVERLRACPRWEEIGAHVPPGACRRLFAELLFKPQWYEQNRFSYARVLDKSARRLAIQLHGALLASDGAPGLSQGQRETLVAMLSRLIDAEPAPAGLSDTGKAMPRRPARKGAVRTFVIRSIALRLAKYSDEPMHAAIADLAQAALAELDDPNDPANAEHARDARKGWSPE